MTTRTHLIYAGRLERLFANLLDTLILLLPNSLIAGLMSHTGSDGALVPGPATIVVLFLCNAAYFTLFTSGRWQATPGKRLLGIHIIRTDGGRIDQPRALERFLAFALPQLPAYTSLLSEEVGQMLVIWLSLLWFGPILLREDRAGLHDRLCNTRVVVGRLI